MHQASTLILALVAIGVGSADDKIGLPLDLVQPNITVAPAATVCFLEGPEGAHKMVNRTDQTAHVLMLSTRRWPAVAVYPDSQKVGVFGDDPGARIMARRESDVDYWDGER